MIARPALLLFLTLAAVHAAPRTWTDTKGRRIEAEFVSQAGDKVTVRLATGRDVTLVKSQLSAADQEFLKTATAAPAAAPAGRAAFTGQTYESARLDKSKWGRPGTPRDFKIKGVEFPNQMETDHFFIAAGPAVKPAVLDINAEACERLFAHMVRLLPLLQETFRERRLSIWMPANGEDLVTLGYWIDSFSDGSFGGSPTNYIAGATLPEAFATQHKFVRDTRLLRVDYPAIQRATKWGPRFFFISSTAFSAAGQGVKANGGNSLGMLEMGWSYFLESDICGNITTEVSFGRSGSTVEGFRNGRTWPAAVKAVLKNGGTKPGVALLLQRKQTEAQPIDVGLAFGFCHWCFRDPARAKQFNDMYAAAIAASQAPDPETFAKAFGFADTAAFDKAFTDYLMSDRFK